MKLTPNPSYMLAVLLCATSCAVLLSAPRVSAQDKPENTFTYTTKIGDSCIGLAQRFYNNRGRYDLIHRHNPWMGPTPHTLTPGMKLVLPLLVNDPDARVTGRRGKVRARSPRASDWRGAKLGLDLYRAWRVNSQESSSAELTFIDDSRLYMRDNTLVVIYGSSNAKVRRRTTEAELESGALRTRLADLAGDTPQKPGAAPRLRVTTPSAESDLGAGETLVTVDESKNTRVANHRGKPATVYGLSTKPRKSRKSVKVKAGWGSKVRPGKEPEPPKPLPPAPVWASGNRADGLAFNGANGRVVVGWKPVDKAARYRMEFFSDADRTQSLGTATIDDPKVTTLDFSQPPGTYYIALAAIDDDRFEGPPSDVLTVHIQGAALLGTTGQPSTTDDLLLPGASVSAPDGGSCTVGGGAPTNAITFDQPGDYALQCSDGNGHTTAPRTITVTRIKLTALPTAGLTEATLTAGVTDTLKLELSQDVGDTLTVTAPEPFSLGAPERKAPTRWEIPVTVPKDAPKTVTFQVAAGSGSSAAPLGTVEASVAGPPGDDIVVEIGLLGAFHFSADPETDPNLTGSRTAVYPSPYALFLFNQFFGLELEVRFGVDQPTDDTDPATLVGYRAQGLFQLHNGETFKPFVLLGHGGDYPLSGDTSNRISNYAGVGSRINLSDAFGLRIDLRGGVLNTERAEAVPMLNTNAGVFYRF